MPKLLLFKNELILCLQIRMQKYKKQAQQKIPTNSEKILGYSLLVAISYQLSAISYYLKL